jgi:hypothetical protein
VQQVDDKMLYDLSAREGTDGMRVLQHRHRSFRPIKALIRMLEGGDTPDFRGHPSLSDVSVWRLDRAWALQPDAT